MFIWDPSSGREWFAARHALFDQCCCKLFSHKVANSPLQSCRSASRMGQQPPRATGQAPGWLSQRFILTDSSRHPIFMVRLREVFGG